MSTTGDRIRELRIKQNLTLDDVAQYLGVGRQAIYKYEHGAVTNIPLDNIEKMAALFGVTPGYLSGWSGEDSPAESDPEISIVSGMMESMSKEQKQQVIDLIKILVKKG